MKILKLIAVVIVFLTSSSIQAQVSVNINIGSPPPWGPVGYSEVEYYYLPDIEVYYDIRASQFIYFGGGRWIRVTYLPRQYRSYDLYSGYKVVLTDYHGPRPYSYFKNHKVKYYKGYKGKPQKTIGQRREKHREYDNQGNNGHKEGKGHGKNKK